MPEPGDTPGLTDIARRWAVHVADLDGVTVAAETLETALLAVAHEARADATAARDAALRRFDDLYSACPVGVVLTDVDGTVSGVNPAFVKLLQHRPSELVGRPVTELAATAADAETLSALLDGIEVPARRVRRERLTLSHATDGTLKTRVTATRVAGAPDGPDHPVLLVEDHHELDLLSGALHKQNVHDSLTGLPNSYHFEAQLEIVLGARTGESVALVYLDIDGFRVVNDGLGRAAADDVLRQVAQKLNSEFSRPGAVVARLSGDGFAVLLRGDLDGGDVVDLVEDAMRELAEPVYVAGKGVGVNVSAGIVVTESVGQPYRELQRAAEMTLHRAKENGRAQWLLFDAELHEHDRRRYALGAEIGGGLENGQFEVHYEPTVKLDGSDRIAVVNAVLSWNHPERGKLGPDDFCALADATGMTPALGQTLLAEAMSDAAAWQREFPASPDLCVRLPTRFAIDPNLVRIVRTELDRTGLPPHKLRICTDSVAVNDPRGEVLDTLSVLADLGVKITLAVSGAADLELIRVHHLPVGFVILGGPLIDAIAEDDSGQHRHLATLLHRAEELGIGRVGADGVHSTEHARRLADLGVVAGRGKLFGEDVTAAEIRSMLAAAAEPVRP